MKGSMIKGDISLRQWRKDRIAGERTAPSIYLGDMKDEMMEDKITKDERIERRMQNAYTVKR